MKANLNFDQAWEALSKLVADIENEEIPLEELAAKVKEAKKLIQYCDAKLKGIESDLNQLKDTENQ